MGEPGHHNKDLFRLKRQTEPLVHHSDARNAKKTQEGADDQVEKWLKRVEAATDVAARRTFSTEEVSQQMNLMISFCIIVNF